MKKRATKVMVFGVFDLLHPGHLNFLVQARDLGDKLIVSVARDLNVFKIKGQRPMHRQSRRLKALTLLPMVDKVVLGGLRNPWPHIVREKPDIIALGYDQNIYVNGDGGGDKVQERQLKQALEKHGLKKTQVVRLAPHWPEVYKSKLLRKKYENV